MQGARRIGSLLSLVGIVIVALLVVSCGPATEGTSPAGAAASATSTAAPADSTNPRTVTVNGSGIVNVTPDTATALIGALVTDPSITTALNGVNDRMTAIIKVLHDNGIADKDIQTVNFDIVVEHDYNSPSQPVTGYFAMHIVRFSVSPTDKIGPIIGAAVEAGANQVNQVVFTTADPSSANKQARDLAVDDALTKAQQLAEAAGAQVGAPLSIAETPMGFPNGRPIPAAGGSAAVPIEAGQQQIGVNVTITYELK